MSTISNIGTFHNIGRRVAGVIGAVGVTVAVLSTPSVASAQIDYSDPDYRYWVNEGSDLLNRYGLVHEMQVAKDVSSVQSLRSFSGAEYYGYGDIAITNDGKTLYGIQYINTLAISEFPRLTKHDADSGEVRWSYPIRKAEDGSALDSSDFDIFDFAGAQANALSMDAQGRVILASPKSSAIYRADPDNIREDRRGKKYVPAEKMEISFPRLPDRGTRLYSAGDFVVGPDGSLYGLATADPLDAGGNSYLVRWNATAGGTDFEGPGEVIGRLKKAGYGLARIGNKLVMAATHSTFGSGRNNETYVFDLREANPPGSNGSVPDLPVKSIPMTGFSRPTWGATSVGESGPTNSEVQLVVRKDFVDRKNPTDQVGLWSSAPDGSHLFPKQFTSGVVNGLQEQTQGEYVRVGSQNIIHEEAVGGLDFSDYQTSLKCEAQNQLGIPTGEVLTPSKFVTTDAKIEYKVTVSSVPKSTTVCTFVNDPTPPPPPVYGDLPDTGAKHLGIGMLGTSLITLFLAAPLALRRRSMA